MAQNQPIAIPTAGGIVVCPLVQAKKHKKKFQAVLTIEDPKAKFADQLRFTQPTDTDHLVIKFEDADSVEFGYMTATMEQVKTAIAFGRKHAEGTLLVHCLHGVGRSAACALAIIADRNGPGAEKQSVAELLAIRPTATPNLVVVAHADEILGLNGALIKALSDSESANPVKVQSRSERKKLAEENPGLFQKA